MYNTRKLGIQYSKRRKQEEKDVPVIYGQGRHPADNGKNHMTIFADSDYADCDSRRSTQGIVIMMNGGPIAWTQTTKYDNVSVHHHDMSDAGECLLVAP